MSDIAEWRRHAERGHGVGYKQLTELLDRLELAEADVQEHNRTYAKLEQYEKGLRDLAKNECSHCMTRRKAREALAQADSVKKERGE